MESIPAHLALAAELALVAAVLLVTTLRPGRERAGIRATRVKIARVPAVTLLGSLHHAVPAHRLAHDGAHGPVESAVRGAGLEELVDLVEAAVGGRR